MRSGSPALAVMESHTGDRPQANPPPKGIYVPVPTFFSPDPSGNSVDGFQLDLKTQTRHTQFLVENGIKGVVLLGSTGEAINIRRFERHHLIRSQREFLDANGFQDRPIIAGTCSQNLDDTLQSIQDSKNAGAEFAMVLAPGFFASVASQDGIRRWFETIAESSPLPILIYHYPGVTNNLYIAPETFVDLARHPNIVGTKLSHGIIDDQTLIASSPLIDHEHFSTFTGLGQNLLPFLAIGGSGAIDGLAGCFPRTVVHLFNSWSSSQGSKTDVERMVTLGKMRELQHRICEGEKLIARWGVVGIKEALARTWQIGDPSNARLPVTGGFPDGDREWSRWEGAFGKLKEFEQSLSLEGKH